MVYTYAVGAAVLLIVYLWHVNRGMSGSPPDAAKLTSKRWTPDKVREAYEKTKVSPTDVSKHLPPRQGRRYIVIGGSGLVGGWIVQHLLLRGEDPEAIRLLDLRPPTQSAILESKVQFIKTDVSSADSVNKAFTAQWPSHVSNLPITVFHTVAYINPSERTADSMPMYQAVNINGTKHVLEAAQKIGATVAIVTASGSIGVQPPSFFLSPFARWPVRIFQIVGKVKASTSTGSLSDYGSCYAYSKAVAESHVLASNNSSGLRTGCIRPGHAIYGAGVSNVSSISWSYLSRGGSPSWLWDCVTNGEALGSILARTSKKHANEDALFVNAQNVSIAHLAYEKALLDGKDVGGKTYYVTDPNPPMYYGDLYTMLSTMAHKDTPCAFPKIPALPMLLIGYVIETWMLMRARYLNFLPPITGDIAMITPAMFNMSTVHIVYDNTSAREEIGYNPPIETMEGLCLQMLEWNAKVEKGIIEKGGLVHRSGSAGISAAVPVPVEKL